MSVNPKAWAVRCNSCKTDVSLLGPTPGSNAGTLLAPPSRAAFLRRKELLPICTGLFGVLAIPTAYFLDRNDSTHRAPIIAIVASILGFALYRTGRRILGCLLALSIAIILVAKPFIRPVMLEGREFSLTSETHYYFLIPGLAMLAVFALLFVQILEQRESPSKDSVALRVAAGAFFIVGMALGYLTFGGPTVADVIKQYEPQGIAMRKQFFNLAKSLPLQGSLEPRETKLDPPPVWLEGQPEKTNIEIVTVEELWSPEETPKNRNLYLSNDLLHCVRWTGPKNPMASSAMGERAGDFTERMRRAFGLPWLAAYRPGSPGLEIFVFDLRTSRLVAATRAKGTVGIYEKDRKLVLDALAKATGGTFTLK